MDWQIGCEQQVGIYLNRNVKNDRQIDKQKARQVGRFLMNALVTINQIEEEIQ